MLAIAMLCSLDLASFALKLIIVLIYHETDGKFFGGISILNIEHGFVASFILIFSPNHEFRNLSGAMKS